MAAIRRKRTPSKPTRRSGCWQVVTMDWFVGSFWTKRAAIEHMECLHLGKGKRRRLKDGTYEIMPKTDSNYQPTYYVGEYDKMYAAGWGETIQRNDEQFEVDKSK